MSNIRVLALTGLILFIASSAAVALEPINKTWGGTAIKGFDPVAYFTDSRPAKGDKQWSHTWQDARWLFASEAYRDRFAADPESYAPQYGGYCAYAVSEGNTAGIDPEQWSIVDGKLYLNYSAKIKKTWEQDIQGRIARSDENWPRLLAE